MARIDKPRNSCVKIGLYLGKLTPEVFTVCQLPSSKSVCEAREGYDRIT